MMPMMIPTTETAYEAFLSWIAPFAFPLDDVVCPTSARTKATKPTRHPQHQKTKHDRTMAPIIDTLFGEATTTPCG